MTVQELIEKLQQFPANWELTVLSDAYVQDILNVEQETTVDFDDDGMPVREIGLGSVVITLK